MAVSNIYTRFICLHFSRSLSASKEDFRLLACSLGSGGEHVREAWRFCVFPQRVLLGPKALMLLFDLPGARRALGGRTGQQLHIWGTPESVCFVFPKSFLQEPTQQKHGKLSGGSLEGHATQIGGRKHQNVWKRSCSGPAHHNLRGRLRQRKDSHPKAIPAFSVGSSHRRTAPQGAGHARAAGRRQHRPITNICAVDCFALP